MATTSWWSWTGVPALARRANRAWAMRYGSTCAALWLRIAPGASKPQAWRICPGSSQSTAMPWRRRAWNSSCRSRTCRRRLA